MSQSTRAPRRVVLLEDNKDGAIAQVLKEYAPEEVSGNRLHEDVQSFAQQHVGRFVAAEWFGPLGWTRFLWCRK